MSYDSTSARNGDFFQKNSPDSPFIESLDKLKTEMACVLENYGDDPYECRHAELINQFANRLHGHAQAWKDFIEDAE